MDISVIIPVYNVEPYIIECIDSLYTQKHTAGIRIEVIIADDCGTDNSMEAVRRYIEENDLPFATRIITHPTNKGLSAARNTGIHAASGKYLFFLDSDDVIAEDCLYTLWNEAKAHPEADIIYGYTECFPDATVLKELFAPTRNIAKTYLSGTEYKRKHFEISPLATNKLIRYNLIIEHNLYFKEGIIHEDYYWHYITFEHIHSAAFPAKKAPTYYYRQRENSITAGSTGETRIANMQPVHDALFEYMSHTKHIGFTLMWNLILILNTYKHSPKYTDSYTHYWNQLYHAKASGRCHHIILLYHRLPRHLQSIRVLYRLIKYLIKD